MRQRRQLLCLVIVVCTCGASLRAQSRAAPPRAGSPASASDLTRERTLVEESDAARDANDYAAARAKIAEAVTSLGARPAAEQDAEWLTLLNSAGRSAYFAQDLDTAKRAWQQVVDVRSRTLPEEHADLQTARGNLALAMRGLGDLAGARPLLESVLDVLSRTLPDEHFDLQAARLNLAITISALGDLSGARALSQKVLDVFSRTLPEDHPALQMARGNLAVELLQLGDVASARALLERVLEVYSRTLPDDHPDLQLARQNLAETLVQLGDLAGARALFEKVLEVGSRTLPDDHPDLQAARLNVAGRLEAAGDLAGSRTLLEKVVEVDSRTLPDDHPDLQRARGNLATTIAKQGDRVGARALFEKVLEVNARTLPAAHPDLQRARENLAATLSTLGDLSEAGLLFEKVLEARLAALPDEHPELQDIRTSVAAIIAMRTARARRLSTDAADEVRNTREQRLRTADLIGALCRSQVRAARDAIVGNPGREAEERCSSLAVRVDTALSFASGYGVFEPLRTLESEAFVLSETTRGASILSTRLARRAASTPKYGELRAALSRASDELAALAQQGTTSAEFERARTQRESVERELARLGSEGSGGESSGAEVSVESLAAKLSEGEAAVGFRRFKKARVEVLDDLDSTGQPAVHRIAGDRLGAFVVRSSRALARSDSAPPPTLAWIDMGPIDPIEALVGDWRDGLGVSSASRGVAAGARTETARDVRTQGAALREKIFDPLLPALAGTQRVIVALDDILHLVAIDALPLDESTLVGDRWRIETRTTLSELLQGIESSTKAGPLVAFGDIEYGAGESGASPAIEALPVLAAAVTEPHAIDGKTRTGEHAGILRGSAWAQGFSALPATGVEVRGIARCFAEQSASDAPPELCERSDATRERFFELAPGAQFLHIATHGWFAPDSVKSWGDSEPLDKLSGLGLRLSGQEHVKGMSAMLLCGLAFAGANLPEDALGRVPGLVTADELSTFDLTNCELVVLSACDTNVGVRRAGQGVASLQKALQMAGARSVITSLWKVPDEATKELMLDFYRHLVMGKKPKWQALWEAKRKLRDARDERGEPKYSTRDWAAWVLTGDPE